LSDDAAPWRRKTDHRLRTLMDRIPEVEYAYQRVNVLVCFVGPVEPLQQLGLQIRSLAGNIASATLVLADLAKIAGSPDVKFIELAQQLAPDAPAGNP
jgi:hypothetical protein